MNFRRAFLLSLVTTFVLTGPAAFAASYVDQGMEAYDQKRYYAAEDLFNKALQENPGNQSVYYFLGKTLEHLYDTKSAKEAYQNCFRINPFSVQGKYAKQAVTQLSGQIEADNHTPADTPQMTAKTISEINRQAADSKQRYDKVGTQQAAWSITKANNELAQLGYRYRMSTANLGPNTRKGTINMGDMSSMYAINTSYIRTDGQVQANLARAAAAKAQTELQTSANNLEYLLADKKQPGEAKLRAFGTNLFVRYYGNEDHEAPTAPPDPMIELKATQMRLSELPPLKASHQPTQPGSEQYSPQELKAVQEKFDSQTGLQSYR
jgi:tetratricopeptide (TPR) repeat protein